MIDKNSFSPERIADFRKNKNFNKTDPAIIEKMIRALVLLEHISIAGLDFVFKGGTCLILLLDRPNRFSIDIDIITEISRENLEEILNSVINKSDFINYKLDEKRSYLAGIPKAHYKFYWSEKPADYILLDILFEHHNYPEIIEMEIKTEWLITEKPYPTIKTPTVESILGDKLTAFAPNTTGVPYNRNKETEIIKQLFDVSVLIEEIEGTQKVYESFIATARNEVFYRKKDITPDDILDDILETALLLSRREKNITSPDKEKFMELSAGIRSFNNFLIRDSFRIEHSIEASSKAAWFAMKLKRKDFSPIKLYNDTTVLGDWKYFDPKYAHLGKLRKANKVAYFYWVKTLELLYFQV